ncbi:MAG: hypothetical protein M1608_04895 [Candidatus Omnitrophica bacterium]|nr:hypothetical protein [Candidatus Omnitrophota bacterium]
MKTAALILFPIAAWLAGCPTAPAMSSSPTNLFPPSIDYDRDGGGILLRNGSLTLRIKTRDGLDPWSLVDNTAGMAYADADYQWPGGGFPQLVESPEISKRPGGSISVVLTAQQGSLEIRQTWEAPAREPGVLNETIRLRNTGTNVLRNPHFICGMSKRVRDGEQWAPRMADARFSAIPYRVQTETGEWCDYSFSDLATKTNWYSTARNPIYARVNTPIWGSEGWAWCEGHSTLLIIKYNPNAMEWSLLEPNREKDQTLLRFGGAGIWKMGDPEGAASLAPGSSFTFGTTRYQVVDGGWKGAFCEFRRFMDREGHITPPGFNPPVHWNELYDNGAAPYGRAAMEGEAKIAHELGCECLYLDPGWDSSFGSTLWATNRLGDEKDFVRWLKEKFDLNHLALHTPLAPWTDPQSYPIETRCMNQQGKRTDLLCTASSVYLDIKLQRLLELCRNGAYFLMFDGSWFEPCWDQAHGHSVPLTHQEHLEAIPRLLRGVHKAYPNVLIEQHDPMTGPGTPRYTPTYLLHGKPGSFDELWGYEFMNEPLDDLYSRRAMSLYYVNLAYSIPIYLHIDLRKDNDQAQMFWWYASTCRHLGVGGKSADIKIWEAQKTAMREYMRFKPFFTQGVFYGLGETVHAHTLPDRGECIIDVFNLAKAEVEREIRFQPRDIGLPPGPLAVEGALWFAPGTDVCLSVRVPANGHQLVHLQLKQ